MALVKIISGEKNSGKTTLALEFVREFREKGMRVSGYLSVADQPEKSSYHILDLETDTRLPAVAAEPPAGEPGWKKYDFSRFYFSERAFSSAREILQRAAQYRKNGIIIVDELGPLELSGGGSMQALPPLVDGFSGTLYLVIRQRLVKDFISVLGIEEPEIVFPDQAQ